MIGKAWRRAFVECFACDRQRVDRSIAVGLGVQRGGAASGGMIVATVLSFQQ